MRRAPQEPEGEQAPGTWGRGLSSRSSLRRPLLAKLSAALSGPQGNVGRVLLRGQKQGELKYTD